MPSGDAAESNDRLPHFDTVLRGYNPRQVNERVTRLTYDLRHATKDRDEAASKIGELTKSLGSLQQQLLETTTRLNRISANPNSTEGMTERVRLMMQLAEEEIAEFKRQADEYGKSTRADMLEFVKAYDKPGITKQVKFDSKGEVADKGVWAYKFEGGKIVALKEIK